MARVYRARDPDIDRTVAIKLLKDELCVDKEYVNRFLREARAAGAISHPNIVTIFDVGRHGDTPYITMEFMDEKSLGDVLSENAKIVGQAGADARHATRPRARPRAPPGHRPSRREAGQHPADGRRPDRQDHRFRHRPPRQLGRPAEDQCRHRSRHAALHVARTGRGPERRRPLRPVLARRHPLRAPDREEGVRQQQRRDPDLPDHAQGPAADPDARCRMFRSAFRGSWRSSSPSARIIGSRPARRWPKRFTRELTSLTAQEEEAGAQQVHFAARQMGSARGHRHRRRLHAQHDRRLLRRGARDPRAGAWTPAPRWQSSSPRRPPSRA